MKARTSNSRPPRILYLAFFFPPSRSSGVYRARATAEQFAAAGWDVTVHTAPREFYTKYIGSVDESLEAGLDPRIEVSRPGMGYFRWREVREYGRFRANMPVLANVGYNYAQRHFFPEHYASWIPHVVARALRQHARKRFDLILATGNPFASFAAASWLHRLTGVPYALDYRDSWTLDLFSEQDKYPAGHPAWAWERRAIEGAAVTAFVNEGLRGWHAERYPAAAERMVVVPNGWEPEILGRAQYPGPAVGRPLRFGYIGTLTESQPLATLFDGWRAAKAHPELADATLDLYGHLGFYKETAHKMVAQIPADPGLGVNHRGPLSKTEVGQAYRSLDVLVFLAAGAKYVTSGKIFEYMATGKPIVSVHAPGIAATDVLKGDPLWYGIDRLDPQSVANAMVSAAKTARDLTEPEFDAALDHAERYTRANTLGPFEQRLREVVERRSGR